MIDKVIAARNLTNVRNKVVQNKGVAGVDGMITDKLKAYIDAHGNEIVSSLISKSYRPQAIKVVSIPKSGGSLRL